MATRTLGVKFEVVGFKEAANSIEQLKKGINDGLKANRQATNTAIADSQKLAKEEVEAGKKIARTSQEQKDDSFLVVPQVDNFKNQESGKIVLTDYNYLESSHQVFGNLRNQNYRQLYSDYAVPRVNKVRGGFFEGIGSEYGRRAANTLDNTIRKLLGFKAYQEETSISDESAAKIGIAVASRFKNVRINKSDLEGVLKPWQKNKLELPKQNIFTNAFSKLLTPLRTVSYGFYEGIGNKFGEQFSKGLSDVLNNDLDFSMERKGQVTGKGFSFLATTGKDNVFKNFEQLIEKITNFSDNPSLEKFLTLFKSLTKTIVSVPANYQTGYRKGAVEIEGVRKLKQEIANFNYDEVADLSDKNQVVFTVGGFAAEEGQSGHRMADVIKEYADDKTEVLGADNSFTDLKFSVFGNKALWGANLVGKIGQMNLKGYNPDSVKLAAQVIALLEKNPNLKARVTGHSAGGFIVEELQELLDLLGYGDRVTTIATGTPLTQGGLKNQNTRQVIGDNDDIIKTAEAVGEFLGATQKRNTEDEIKGVTSHFGGDYLRSEDYLRTVLGEGFNEAKGQELREAKKQNNKFFGKLIELESLYVKYISYLYQTADELIEEIDIRPERLVAKARRAKLRDRGRPAVYEELTSRNFQPLKVKEETENAVLVIGGLAGMKGKSGEFLAAKMGKLKKDNKTQFLGVRNEFTDMFTPEELQNLEAPEATRRVMEMFAQVHQLGYNPDAVQIAAQVLDLQAKNPNLKIKIAGYSAGGYVAEDVAELLSSSGADMSKIELLSAGTPNLPGGIKNKEFEKILGDRDNIFGIQKLKDINRYTEEVLGFSLFEDLARKEQNLPGINSHDFFDYLRNSPEMQNFVFGQNSHINKLFEIDDSINKKNQTAAGTAKLINLVNKSSSLTKEQKLDQLQKLKEQYVKTLQDIILLAEEAKKLGGGRKFSQEGKSAAKDIEKINEAIPAPAPPSRDVGDIDREINEKLSIAREIETGIENLSQNPNITEEQALESVIKYRNIYIKVFQDIVLLAQRAKKLGKITPAIANQEQYARTKLQELNAPIPPSTNDNYRAETVPDPWKDNNSQESLANYKQEYKQFLDGLVAEAKESADNVLVALKPDYNNLSIQERKQYFKSFRKEIDTLALQYREALKKGDLTLARKIGEDLLKKIQYNRKIYQDIKKVAKGDRSLAGNQAQLTSIETEIRTGQPTLTNKGRDGIGLENYFDDAIEQYRQGGSDVVAGFVEGIVSDLDEVREAAKKIGKEAEDSTDDQLGINSPSLKFKKIGSWVIQGFVAGILTDLDNVRKVAQKIGEITENSTRKQLGINSKSKKFIQIGKWVVEGFRYGLKEFGLIGNELEQKGRDVVKQAQQGIKAESRKTFVRGARAVYGKSKELLTLAGQDRPEARAKILQIQKEIKSEIQKLKQELGQEFASEIADLEDFVNNKAQRRIVSSARAVYEQGKSVVNESIKNAPEAQAKIQEVTGNVSEGVEGLKDEVQSEFSEELLGLENFISEHQDKFLADNIERFLDAAGAGIIKKIGSLIFDASQSDEFDKIVGTVIDLIGKITKLVLGFKLLKVAADAFGVKKLVEGFSNLPEAALDAANAVEVLDNRIIDISQSAIEGAKNLDFIRQTANELEKDLTGAKENYAELLGATQFNSLKGVQTENIYTAFAGLSKKKGLSNAQEERLFKSIRSMIGKEILSQEEVRQEIAEVLPDFPQALASSIGVTVPQLNSMIESRQVTATDALPKVAQYYMAQGSIADSSETGAAAVNRLNSAITRFRESVGFALQPIQKFGNNFLAGFFNNLADGVGKIESLMRAFFALLFINILKFQIFGQSIQKILLAIIKLIWTARGALASFGVQLVALTLAIKAVTNTWKLWSNSFPQAEKNIKSLTLGIEKLGQAYRNAAGEGKELNRNLPSSRKDLNLAEGIAVPESLQWLAGGTHLNVSNTLVGNYNKIEGAIVGSIASAVESLGATDYARGIRNRQERFRFRTQAEKKQDDFQENTRNLLFKTNGILAQGKLADRAQSNIAKSEEEIRGIQSARLTLLPGDREGLENSLNKEREIRAGIDDFARITSQYSANLNLAIKGIKQQIETLDELVLADGIIDRVEEAERTKLVNRLNNLTQEKTRFEKEQSRLNNSLSVFERELRNTTERMAGFNEAQNRLTAEERANIIEQGIEQEKGDRTIEIELDDLTRRDLQNRLNNLDKEISLLEKQLKSPALAPGAQRVKKQLEEKGIPLNEQSLQRIIETSTVAQDRDAAKQLLEQRKLKSDRAQYKQQLAENLKNSRNLLKDFNRTIDDYFFNLAQRIKETQLETKTLISKIFAGSIKTKLQQALVPGSESFVNGLINGIQGILDQAQSLVERELGIEGSKIQLQSESYSLETQLQDFIRSVNGATDAVSRFANSLDRDNSDNSNTGDIGSLTSEGASVAANALKWEGNHFKKGVYAMCAGFVRQILDESGVNVGVTKNPYDAGKQPNNGELMARSFFGDDIGTVFRNKDRAKPGDIIGFFDTYDYGQEPGAITHVGIYQGDGMMVDRSTSSAPVKNRSIDTFGKGNHIFVRPHQYDDNKNNSDIESFGRQMNNRLKQERNNSIELNKFNLGQDKELLNIKSEQQLGTQKRQLETQEREATRSQFAFKDRLAEFADRGELVTAEIEYQRTLRQTQQQFRDINSELKTQKIRQSDNVKTMRKMIESLPGQIDLARSTGQEDIALFLTESLKQIQTALPGYEQLLSNLDEFEEQLPQLQQKVTAELERQGKLKIEAEAINKRSAIQQIKTTISTQRGTNELRRQNELALQRLRLEQQINQIRLKYGDTDYAEQLIQLERQNSLVKEQEITRSHQMRDLQYERQLIDLDSGIKNGRGNIFSNLGLTFKGNKIKREAARASENFRYQQQLFDIEKTYAGNIEKIEILKRKAEELNRVNLEAIKYQFKSLGQTILDSTRNNLTSFFENSFAAFSNNGDKERQLMEQELQYKDELLALEDKYRDNEDALSFAKDRAKELNEQKLDKIKNEFNIFNRVVDAARQAVIALLKEIARMAAVRAAASIISAIVGGGASSAVGTSGATTSMNFDGGVGAFTAKEGITVPNVGTFHETSVPNYLLGGTLMAVSAFGGGKKGKSGGNTGGNITDLVGENKGKRLVNKSLSKELRKTSPAIDKAFKKEGSKGVLGVFTPGEEILSIKTGEAGRYQTLKSSLGTSPLKKVFEGNFQEGGTIGDTIKEKIFAGNFAEGGTIGNINIERNLLRSLDVSSPSINLKAVGEAGNNINSNTQNITNFSATIVTPDADSFRESSYQRQQDIAEALLRANR